MEYKEFFQCIKDYIEESLGKEYMIYEKRIRKNNNVWLNGIVIRYKDTQICPTIYLDDYYYEMKNGRTVESISKEVLKRYQEASKSPIGKGIELSYEYVKDRIIYRLVNKEKNKDMLKECPMISFLDFAVTFHILIDGIQEKEQASICITNEMMKLWRIGKTELKKLARKNTQEFLPPVIYTMSEMIGRLMFDGIQKLETEDFFQSGEKWQEERTEKELELEIAAKHLENSAAKTEMYILTNEKNIHGATSILYQNVIQDFSEKIQSDLYLLPSSVHEFILVPARHSFIKKDLEEMVQSVNQSHLPEEEFLSDFVYYYSRQERKIERI